MVPGAVTVYVSDRAVSPSAHGTPASPVALRYRRLSLYPARSFGDPVSDDTVKNGNPPTSLP
jgi:hypothetical protein